MDREKLRKQAQVLRRKRYARRANQRPKVTNGIIRLEKPLPLPKQPKQLVAPMRAGETLRAKKERVLEAKKRAIALRKAKIREQQKTTARSGGCSGCRRRRTGNG